MKKRSLCVALAAALTIGSAVPAAAAPYGCGRNGRCGQNYADANGDGICDNYADADGDGVNDNCPGYGNGRWGQNYADADGDGICDNFVDADGDGDNDNCQGYGNGQGRRQGGGAASGQGQSAASAAGSVKQTAAKTASVKKSVIKKVQKRLNKMGYRCGGASGAMNAKTKKALKSFKKANGLKVNSKIDQPTLKALKITK